MPSINYLSEQDKKRACQAYQPIILDMGIDALQMSLFLIINGLDIDYVFDLLQGFNTKKSTH
jgi:hypothetical protein